MGKEERIKNIQDGGAKKATIGAENPNVESLFVAVT